MAREDLTRRQAAEAIEQGPVSAQHTPGPWLVEREDPNTENYVIWTRQPHTGELATVNAEDINGGYPAKANAYLMAAAPELLEALRLILEGGMDDVKRGCALGHAAISKTLPEFTEGGK